MTEDQSCPTPSPSTDDSQTAALRAIYKHRREPFRNLSIGDLTDLLIAWQAGEVSEGLMTELTGFDRITLRGLCLDAIDRATALCESWRSSQDKPIVGLLASLKGPGPEPGSSSR